MPRNKAIINILLVSFVLFLGYASCSNPAPKAEEESLQESVKTPYKFEDERVRVADSLYSKRKYPESIPEYEKAKAVFEKAEHWEGLLHTFNQLAISYRRTHNQAQAQVYFEAAKELVKEKFDGYHFMLAKTFYYQTVREYIKKNHEEASRFVDTAFSIMEKADKYDSALLKNIVRYKYYTYFDSKRNLDTCIKYLNIREAIYERSSLGSILDKNNLMGNYVQYYRHINDFDKAQIYAQRNLMLFNDKDSRFRVQRLYANYSLATVHFDKDEYRRTIELTDQMIDSAKSILSADDISWADFYNLKAISMVGLDMHDRAINSYKQVRTIFEAKNFREDAYWQNLQNTAIAYEQIGEPDKAELLLKEALSGMQKQYKILDSRTTDLHYFLGNFYFSIERYTEALSQYDSALRSVLEFNSRQIQSLPNVKSKVSRRTLLALQKKAETLSLIYDSSNDNETLLASLRHVDFTDSIITNNRSNYEFAEGRLFLAEYFKRLYEIGLETSFKGYGQVQKTEMVDRALEYMSRSKNVLFLDQSGEYELVTNSSVPDSLREAYLAGLQRIEILDEELGDLMKSNFTNAKIQQLNMEKMTINGELTRLRNKLNVLGIGSENSDESDIKAPIAIREYLSQHNKKALVEYFVGEDAIYVVGLDANNSTFYRAELDDEHFAIIDTLTDFFSSRPEINNSSGSIETFGKAAFGLYKRLIEPAITGLEDDFEELVVIPDEYLSQIPFETMLTNFDGDERSFRELDYAIREYKTSYRLSSRLLISKDQKRDSKAKKRMLGFGFSGESLGNLRSEFSELPGTTEEIDFLKSNIPGDYFLGTEASKQEFAIRAGDYAILHLAVHGEADTANRHKSRLIFNGVENNVLKSNDLYGLGLNADLVILSACESGIGALNKGEGTFSIARSFALAGVSNLVMSLWKVDDKVASELMVGFHKNLMNGKETIADALHKSKLNYLEAADEYGAHPYYWGAFVSLNGDVSIPKENQRLTTILIMVFALVALSSIGFIRYNKR